MIKRFARLGQAPHLYKVLFLILLAMLLYIEILAPITGLWSPREPSFTHLWLMKGQ
jgi:hypothetical protein